MNILNKTHPSNQIKMHTIQNNDQMVLIKNKPKIFDKCIKHTYDKNCNEKIWQTYLIKYEEKGCYKKGTKNYDKT